jgi:hypothetical protein
MFILFFIIFMKYKTFNFLFEKKYNNINDYNDINYTGGITFEFNPFRHFY